MLPLYQPRKVYPLQVIWGSVMALPIVGEYMKKIYDDGRFGISRTDQFVRPAMMPRYDCEDEVDSEGRNNPEDENFFD